MKEKIVIFIAGLLLGSILSTGAIFIYTLANKVNNNDGTTVQMPNGNNDRNMENNGNTPPEMPNNGQNQEY